jgi:hypothetical protein
VTDWLCIGGPLHSQYRPAGRRPMAVLEPYPKQDYALTHAGTEEAWAVKVAVAIPPRPVIYYAQRVKLPGWTITPMSWMEASLAAGTKKLDRGLAMPGYIEGARLGPHCTTCRWCFGQPMDAVDVCHRSRCIANRAWLHRPSRPYARPGWRPRT